MPTQKAKTYESQIIRKQRIIDQALLLVQEHGLDHLSIHDIAKACQLGPGQIYRCFKDKDEIIKYIIQEISKKRVQNSQLNSNNMIPDISKNLALGCPHQLNKNELYLLYEALNLDRNQKNYAIVEESEHELMQKGLTILKSHYPNASNIEIRAMAEIIATLSDGTILRTAKGYTENVDKLVLEKFYLNLLSNFDLMFKNTDSSN